MRFFKSLFIFLDNGFKILVLNKQCKFFNFNLGIKIGSAYETDNENMNLIPKLLYLSQCPSLHYQI